MSLIPMINWESEEQVRVGWWQELGGDHDGGQLWMDRNGRRLEQEEEIHHKNHQKGRLFSRFQRQPSVSADAISFTGAIQCCEKGAAWETAMDLLNQMGTKQVFPTAVTYDASLNVCRPGAASEQWQLSMSLFRQLRRREVQADAVLFHTLADTAVKASTASATAQGPWPKALVLLQTLSRRKLRPDAFSVTVELSAWDRSSSWEKGLLLHDASNLVTSNAALSACGRAHWVKALALFHSSRPLAAEQDLHGLRQAASGYSSTIGALRCERWDLALHLLHEAEAKNLSGFAIFASALSSCEFFQRWEEASSLLRMMLHARIEVDNSIARSAIASASNHWESALAIFTLASSLQLDVESYRTLLWSMECASAWAETLWILQDMSAVDDLCYLSAIRSCANSRQLSQGINALWDFDAHGVESRKSFLPCALASLLPEDPEVIASCVRQHLRENSLTSISTGEAVLLLWSFTSLGVVGFGGRWWKRDANDAKTWREVFEDLKEEELVLLGGAAAVGADANFFVALQDFILSRGATLRLTTQLALSTAYDRAELPLPARLRKQMQAKISQISCQNSWPEIQRYALRDSLPWRRPSFVLSEHPDCFVLEKESNWECFGGHAERQLLHLLQRLCQWPILDDASCQFGFLHRLDIPSSGLVLLATSHERYYDLQLQLRSGQITRDYAVLSHGWVPTSRRELHASIHWGSESATRSFAGGRGKHSVTLCKVLAYFMSGFSFLLLRILTGRRHQIRCHLSHVGHPVAGDGQYTTEQTRWTSPMSPTSCGGGVRHFLHRYHLTFDSTVSVLSPLPEDLRSVLSRLFPVHGGSQLSRWMERCASWSETSCLEGSARRAADKKLRPLFLGWSPFGQGMWSNLVVWHLGRSFDLTCTKLCKTLIQTGLCEDRNCSYAHSKDELRATRYLAQRAVHQPSGLEKVGWSSSLEEDDETLPCLGVVTSTFHKTKLCRFSQMGHCALGSKCNFAHSEEEIRPLDTTKLPEPPVEMTPERSEGLRDGLQLSVFVMEEPPRRPAPVPAPLMPAPAASAAPAAPAASGATPARVPRTGATQALQQQQRQLEQQQRLRCDRRWEWGVNQQWNGIERDTYPLVN
eukprot:s375_g19.t1